MGRLFNSAFQERYGQLDFKEEEVLLTSTCMVGGRPLLLLGTESQLLVVPMFYRRDCHLFNYGSLQVDSGVAMVKVQGDILLVQSRNHALVVIELVDILTSRADRETYRIEEESLDDRILVMAQLMSPIREVLPVIDRATGMAEQQVALVLASSAV